MFFPRPDVASSIRKVPRPKSAAGPLIATSRQALVRQTSEPEGCGAVPAVDAPAPRTSLPATPAQQPVPASVLEHSAPAAPAPPQSPAERPPSRMEPLSPGRFKVQFTADAALKEKLELARDLLRHAVPSGDLSTIVDRALDLLVSETPASYATSCSEVSGAPPLEAATANGTSARCSTCVNTSSANRATRRAVCERDDFRCIWQGPDGVRCGSRAWLEQDHRIPRALGGTTSVENLRLLCRAHNRRAAELVFGRRHIEEAIISNQARHREHGCPAPTRHPSGQRHRDRRSRSRQSKTIQCPVEARTSRPLRGWVR